MSLGCLGSGCPEKDNHLQPSQSPTRLGSKQGAPTTWLQDWSLKRNNCGILAWGGGRFAFQVTQTPRSSTQQLAIPSPKEERVPHAFLKAAPFFSPRW